MTGARPDRRPVVIDDVEAVLFDIDGTLVDSTPAVERTWRTWAARRGLDAEGILRVSHGRRTQDTVAMFVPAPEVAGATAELEELERYDLDDVVALPGAGRLVEAIPGRRWGAVTSGPQALMRDRLRAAGLPAPAVLVAAEDVAEGKPDPEGYRKAARMLGVEVTRCVVIEDAPAGIAAGVAAGATVVAVCTSHDRADLGAAHVVVDTLADLEVSVRDSGLQLIARV